MGFVTKEDTISVIGFNKKIENTLTKGNVLSVGDLLEATEETLMGIQNLGTKGLETVLKKRELLEKSEGGYLYDTESFAPEGEKVEAYCVGLDGKFYYDVPLEDLGLTQRSVNSLKKFGLHMGSELYYVSDIDFGSMDNLGTKSVQEIKKRYDEIQFIPYDGEFNERKELHFWSHNLTQLICGHLDVSKFTLRQELFRVGEKLINNNELSKTEEYTIYNREFLNSLTVVREFIESEIIQFISDSPTAVSMKEVVAIFPREFVDLETISQYLSVLERKKAVSPTDYGLWKSENISVVEYVELITDERKAFVLRERISGKTLEEIAIQLDLTRERVRQIILKLWKKAPPLAENKLRMLFQRYQLTQEEFCTVFEEPPSTFYYLSSRYDKGTLTLEDVEEDDTLEERHRINSRKILYRNYVFLQGQPILKDRDNLMKYSLKNIGDRDNTMDELEEYYNGLLEKIDISNLEDFSYSRQALMNKISSSLHALWKYGKKFRYYNIESYDFEDFFEELDLSQYKDIEFSTLKLYRLHPELMEEFNILDEYELHNLLKKLDVEEKIQGMTINRMPLISFGNANREAQVVDLLHSLAPITISEFAKAYEEEYGVLKKTVAANFLTNVSDYLNELNQSMGSKPLCEDGEVFLRHELTEDFYTFERVKDIYLAEFPQGDGDEINQKTMRILGFRTYNTYMIKNTYQSAADYFRYRVLHHDLWNLNDIRKDIRKVMSFESELYKAKENYDILEYENKKFMNIRNLEKLGIAKSNLEKYCEAVANFLKDDTFFTIQSLRNAGFKHDLYDLGYEDYFYASLLATHKCAFSNQRMGHGKVFSKGRKRVYSTEFIHWVVTHVLESQVISLSDFQSLLKEEYDLQVDHYKLLQVVHESDLYYDGISCKIYGSYSIYSDTLIEDG